MKKRLCILFALIPALLAGPVANSQVHENVKGTTVVVVDPSLPSIDILVNQLKSQAQIVYLRNTKDPLNSITKILKRCAPVSSLHLMFEGKPGVLMFAGMEINNDSLQAADQTLSQWRNYFVDEGDIFLYGCEIGKGDVGIAFVRALATSTGLDIAASDNLTGSDVLGGDWYLEVKSGTIENDLLVEEPTQQLYRTILRRTPARSSKKERESI